MSVAQLKEYHDKIRVGNPPAYIYEPDLQNKGFTARCVYQNAEKYGRGSSKKEAQRAAAKNMLEALKVKPIDSTQNMFLLKEPSSKVTNSSNINLTSGEEIAEDLTEDQKVKAMRFLHTYRVEDPKNDARKVMAYDQRIIDEVDMGLKSEDVPKSVTLSTLTNYEDAIDTFKQIMQEMRFKFHCKVPEIKREAKTHYIVLLQIDYKIPLTFGGTGESVESAAYDVCRKAIMELRIYIS